MSNISGFLHKMVVTQSETVRYQLILNDHAITLNDYLNQKICLEFTGEMQCIQCARKILKSFQQGYCYPCMQKINECNNCLIHPEKCLVEEGRCDPADWAHQHCHQPHYVYLANSSALKVGITRDKNIPSRWIDQGAMQAMPIIKTNNRYQAGLVEVALKKFVADKTNWRVMLKQNPSPIDLMNEKNQLLMLAEKELAPLFEKYPDAISVCDEETHVTIDYPVLRYPEKITALSFDKTPKIEGVLLGIKGQYLLLDTGVLNIRKFGGYQIIFDAF